MSKVRVWLALENNFLTMNTCPMQNCQMQLRVFFGIHWKSNKMQKCRSQGRASEKQNCWAPPEPSESQDPEAGGGVSSERETAGRLECAPVLWFADASLCAALHTCVCKDLSGNSFGSGFPDFGCFIPAPSECGQSRVKAYTSLTHIN